MWVYCAHSTAARLPLYRCGTIDFADRIALPVPFTAYAELSARWTTWICGLTIAAPTGQTLDVARKLSSGAEGVFRLSVDLASHIDGPVIFWGCGGQALVLRDILMQRAGTLEHVISDAGESDFHGVPVSSWQAFQELNACASEKPRYFVVAIGGERGEFRLDRFRRLNAQGLRPLTLIHPSATLLSQVVIGQACQILARAVLGVGAWLGDAVIVNTGAIVDHEGVVGHGCHLAPGSVLLGRVTLGDRVFVGANATVLPGLTICQDVIIGAGAVVTSDITSPGTFVGAPARRLPIQ